jgi:UDP-arabinose 4-epimerase
MASRVAENTVIVTGGAGYVGSHACKALKNAGFTPVVIDNLSRGFRQLVQFGPFEQGDLRDAEFLDRVFVRHQPCGVLHFAALAYVQESVEDPARYWDNNVGGSLSLLNAMRQHGLPPLVFSSTCAIYGSVAGAVNEDAPAKPASPYGESKWMVERILASYRAAYGLRAVNMRYFNVAGCDIDGEIGELHDPEPHVIPKLLRTALGLEAEFVINGDDWETPDRSCVRDYIHVSDLANAHVLALQKLLAGQPLREAYNLGNEQGASVKQLLAAAERVTGCAIAHRIGARRAGDPASIIGDATRAKADLGWRCEHTDLDATVQSAWRWLQSQQQ